MNHSVPESWDLCYTSNPFSTYCTVHKPKFYLNSKYFFTTINESAMPKGFIFSQNDAYIPVQRGTNLSPNVSNIFISIFNKKDHYVSVQSGTRYQVLIWMVGWRSKPTISNRLSVFHLLKKNTNTHVQPHTHGPVGCKIRTRLRKLYRTRHSLPVVQQITTLPTGELSDHIIIPYHITSHHHIMYQVSYHIIVIRI